MRTAKRNTSPKCQNPLRLASAVGQSIMVIRMTEPRSYQGFKTKDHSSRMRVTVCTSDGKLEAESRVELHLVNNWEHRRREAAAISVRMVFAGSDNAWHSLLFFRHHHPVFTSALSKLSSNSFSSAITSCAAQFLLLIIRDGPSKYGTCFSVFSQR